VAHNGRHNLVPMRARPFRKGRFFLFAYESKQYLGLYYTFFIKANAMVLWIKPFN